MGARLMRRTAGRAGVVERAAHPPNPRPSTAIPPVFSNMRLSMSDLRVQVDDRSILRKRGEV